MKLEIQMIIILIPSINFSLNLELYKNIYTIVEKIINCTNL